MQKKISMEKQREFNGLTHAFEDILSSSSNDISCTKLIDMGPNLLSIASKPYKLSPKHKAWVRKELKVFEKAKNYPKKSFTLCFTYCSST